MDVTNEAKLMPPTPQKITITELGACNWRIFMSCLPILIPFQVISKRKNSTVNHFCIFQFSQDDQQSPLWSDRKIDPVTCTSHRSSVEKKLKKWSSCELSDISWKSIREGKMNDCVLVKGSKQSLSFKRQWLSDILLILLNQICLHSVFYSLVSLVLLLYLETSVG